MAARRRTAPRSRSCAAVDHGAGERIDAIDAELAAAEAELEDLLLRIPNPADPTSRSAARRRTSRSARGASRGRARAPRADGGDWARRPHWEIGEALDIIDNVRGAKIAGSGFPVYKGAGSRAPAQPHLPGSSTSTRHEHGFTEVWPPAVVNAASARGTGQIPDKEDQMYVVTRDDLYLVPTAEVPVTNLHATRSSRRPSCPIRYAAYSPCFRREAGAAGKDTRGILRVHQFDKVEMVLFEKPEDSPDGARVDDRRAPRSCSSGSGCRTGCS